MIDTIFYFCPTQEQYEQTLAENGGEGISSKTITFVENVREIYFNGRGYGKTSTAGLMSEDAFNTWKQVIQDRIAAIVEEAEEQKELSNQALQNVIDETAEDLNNLRSDLEENITQSINDAITNANGRTIWSELEQTNNQISAATTRLDKFSNADGLVYNTAFQSLVNEGVANNTAFASLSTKWAVQGENQDVLRWLASGFDSQTIGNNVSFARMYSDYRDNTNAAIGQVTESTALVKTTADANSAKLAAIADWSGYVEGQPVNYRGGVVTEANKSGVVSALIAEDANVKAAITAYVNSAGSNITLTADHINLDGTTIAQRLIAASAALGGFVIEQNALVGTTTESGNITRSVTLMPVGLQFDRTDTKGTSVSSDDTVLQKLEINPVDGIKFTQNNSNVSSWFKMDGSGSLANGSLAWSTDGGLMVKTDGIVVDSEHDWELFGKSGTQKGLAAFNIVGDYDQLCTAIYWDCDKSEYVYDYSRNHSTYVSDIDTTVALASDVWGKPGAIFDGSGVGISLFNPSINSSWLNVIKNSIIGPNSTGKVELAGSTNEIHPWTNLRASVFDNWTAQDGILPMGLYISSSTYVDGYTYVYGDLKVYSNTELFGTCTAGSFVKEGSSNNYVLLAGGGTKALSEFTTNGDGVYFPLTGGSLNGHLINKEYSVQTGELHITNPSGTIHTMLRTTIETSEDASYFSIADMSDVTNHYYTIGNLTGHDQLTVEGALLCIGPATATSFVKTNGLSSQFLKADGSVDSTSYLPLTGGTITDNDYQTVIDGNGLRFLYNGSQVVSCYITSDTDGSEFHVSGPIYMSDSISMPYGSTNTIGITFGDAKIYGHTTAGQQGQGYKLLDFNGADYYDFDSAVEIDGDCHADNFTQNSDETLKDKVADVELSAEQIAEAPSIKYTWKDKEKGSDVHIGTIAQYWQDIIPEAVSEGKDGKLSLNYQGLSMAAVISLAKEVVELKAKVAELENKLNNV